MLTTGKGTHYCIHCGFDMKAREQRDCPATDGDLCEPATRTNVAKATVRRVREDVQSIRVQLDFTVDVKGNSKGVPHALEKLSWVETLAKGFTKKDWETIASVRRGSRKLTYLGGPNAPTKRETRRAPKRAAAKR